MADPNHHPELWTGDEPYTYATLLSELLENLTQTDHPGFDPDNLNPDRTSEPGNAISVFGTIASTLGVSPTVIYNDESIVYEYPHPSTDGNPSPLADHIEVYIEYHANGRIWVELDYADAPGKADAHKAAYWIGWIDDYNTHDAYKMGALATIRLLGAYTTAGLSAAEALDLGATAGIGYKDIFSWATTRNVGYEAIRKNASNARDELESVGWSPDLLDREVRVARCSDCGRNMQTAESCDPDRAHLLVTEDGEEYERLPYGNEVEHTIEYMEQQGADEDYIQEYKETASDPDDPDERCHDCGVQVGGIHHEGCDIERCPKCGHQLLACECNFKWVVGDANKSTTS